MKHCMIDLETMGLSPGCAILSIGAVGFDESGLIPGAEFKRNISLRSCLDAGLIVDPDTERWWSEQSPEARAALLDPEPVDLETALSDFSSWYTENEFDRIWSHGAATDVPWLSVAYDRFYGRVDRCPWNYREIRDTRTLYDLAPYFGEYSAEVQHDALEDARVQAKTVVSAMGAVRAAMEATL